MTKNNQNLSDLIQKYIKTQTVKNKKLSETQISEQIGIRSSTFNRIVNGRSQPSLQTLLKLSKIIPEIKSFLPEEMFEVVLKKTNVELLGDKLEALLSDPDIFLIYALAFSENGITEEFIIKNFGSQKIEKLKTLENENFIKREGNGIGVYKVTENKEITMSFDLIKKHIRIINQFYRPDKPERNYAFYSIDTLNRKGALELMQTTKEFHEKMVEIMDKKENKGDIPVFSTGISDIFFEPKTSRGMDSGLN